ncbi:MAG: hypothetical protein HDT30_07755 [Clostridiales bacterium]|nr:hypothetical protein [Clostridiales bacterium]
MDKCFTIYYLNLSKVYELSMMINNVLLSGIQREKENTNQISRSRSKESQGEIGIDRTFLANVKGISIDASENKETKSSKWIETLEVKTTKSTLLKNIYEKAKEVTNFENVNEGDLIKISNIKLNLFQEEETRSILAIRREALKGITYEGIEINNILNSFLQDYSYVFEGSISSSKESVLIKIPVEVESEFENKYAVDDLLIGKVMLLGIYRGDIDSTEVKRSTFSFFSSQEQSKIDNVDSSKIISSGNNYKSFEEIHDDKDDEKQYKFIDLLAIIQEVEFEKEEIIEQPSEKVCWWKRIINKWRSR